MRRWILKVVLQGVIPVQAKTVWVCKHALKIGQAKVSRVIRSRGLFWPCAGGLAMDSFLPHTGDYPTVTTCSGQQWNAP